MTWPEVPPRNGGAFASLGLMIAFTTQRRIHCMLHKGAELTKDRGTYRPGTWPPILPQAWVPPIPTRLVPRGFASLWCECSTLRAPTPTRRRCPR